MKTLTKKTDILTIILYFILIFIGWISIYSSTHYNKELLIFKFQDAYIKQLIWIIFSFILAIGVIYTNSKFFISFASLFYFIFLLLNLLVIFIGKEVKGQKAWLFLGNFGFQPSEFLKFSSALILSKIISSENFKIQSFKYFFITSLIIFFPILLIFLQNDTGTAITFLSFYFVLYRFGLNNFFIYFTFISIILFITSLLVDFLVLSLIVSLFFIIIYLLSNFSKKNLIFTILVSTLLIIVTFFKSNIENYLNSFNSGNINLNIFYFLVYFLVFVIFFIKTISKTNKFPKWIVFFYLLTIILIFSTNYIYNNVLQKHQRERIDVLLGKIDDPKGKSYNIYQSKISIGSGGLLGKGFLNGTQTKLNFVPEQTTDFIFCTIGEEFGFIGSFVFLFLYVLFMYRILYLAEQQNSNFSKSFGYSLFSFLFIHFVINIGMTIGLVPIIGITLPFISYGGSSLWAFTIFLFIFLRLDKDKLKHW